MAEPDDLPPLDDVPELKNAPASAGSGDSGFGAGSVAAARVAAAVSTRIAPKQDVVEEVDDGEALQDQLMRAALGKSADPEAEKAQAAKQAAITKDFGKGGGFKKGFLLGGGKPAASSPRSAASTGGSGAASKASSAASAGAGSASAAAASAAGDLPVLKPTAKGDASSSLRLPEVQEAMRAGTGALQRTLSDTKTWLTPELLARMMKEPRLVAGMQNPRFMAALGEMQKDPKAAMAKHKEDAPLHEFLKAFMGLLGDHFSSLGAAMGEKEKPAAEGAAAAAAGGGAGGGAGSGGAKVAGPSFAGAAAAASPAGSAVLTPGAISAAPASGSRIGMVESSVKRTAMPADAVDRITSATKAGHIAQDDEEVRRVLSDRDVMSTLMDPDMQRILKECSADASRLRFWMGVPDVKRKLELLQKHGLIRVDK